MTASLEEEIKRQLPQADIYPLSPTETEWGQALLLRARGSDLLAVDAGLRLQFEGEDLAEIRLCPLTRQNRKALNRAFPYTVPRALGRAGATFGFGDRLGYANPAGLASLEGTDFLPVLAQQSTRELALMGRSCTQVIDTASWAVFRQGWKGGFGADGDHLKTLEEVRDALDAGCSMITLDCSLVLNKPADQTPDATHYTADYLEGKVAGALGLHFADATLRQLARTYAGAIALARNVAENAIRQAGREIDFELSMDETDDVTTPQAHYYVANELKRAGVEVTGLAPRFVGAFQKAVDYAGDLGEFERQLRRHAQIADHFGHKLSLHSASEKFSVFPILARETGGRCHIKTSGVSWLEAVKCMAKRDPALYRAIFQKAAEHLQEAKRHYIVDCDADRIPPLDALPDSALPALMEAGQSDTRQLMHITYGYILADQALKARVYAFMEEQRAFYETQMLELYSRHLQALRFK